jgi:hypothetical protein
MVTPPPTPVISQISGGDRQITIRWLGNPGANIIGYLLYRTDDEQISRDARGMQPIKANAGDPYSIEVVDTAQNEFEFTDNSTEPIKSYYYGVVAVAEGKDNCLLRSGMSVVKTAQAYDDIVPEPPEWIDVTREPNIAGDKIHLEWKTNNKFEFMILRKSSETFAHTYLSDWQDYAVYDEEEELWKYSFEDNNISSKSRYSYIVVVRGKNKHSSKSIISEEV